MVDVEALSTEGQALFNELIDEISALNTQAFSLRNLHDIAQIYQAISDTIEDYATQIDVVEG